MVKAQKELTRDQIFAEEDALIDFQFALIDAMKERGMTKAELAEAMGVSRARVSQLLSPEANPTLKLVARALHAIGLKTYHQSLEASNKSIEISDFSSVRVRNENWQTWFTDYTTPSDPVTHDNNSSLKWFAGQHSSAQATAWHKKKKPIANCNVSDAMEAA